MMNRNTRKKLNRGLALTLALVFALGMAGCQAREPEPVESPPPSSSSRPSSSSSRPSSSSSSETYTPEDLMSYVDQIAEWQETINSDIIGWLKIPGTNIDDAVVFYPNDPPDNPNSYYLRKDLYKRYSQAGSYFIDVRSKYDGSAAGQSLNTVIYGHSIDMNDDPEADYFSQTKKYLELDFAKENPYIYFSLAGEDLVWEVFSVFHCKTNFAYNTPDPDEKEYAELINEAVKRSEYIYPDIDVSASDKILTLSTCVYKFTPGVYPNEYRYVVMARLKRSDEPFKEEIKIEPNPSPKEP